MNNYESLDDDTLCFTLVGQFMWHWSMLEHEVDQALGNALDLSYMQMTVLADHIKFVDKLKILTGVVTLATFNEVERKAYHQTIDSLLALYRDRNVVAHLQFGPLEGKRGATFFNRQTKKTVKLNEEFWDVVACVIKFARMDKATESIRQLSVAFETDKASAFTRLAKLLAPEGRYGAKHDLFEAGGLGLAALFANAEAADEAQPAEESEQPS